jgi:dipeptidyl aminopeptidase/acylaminoacyl peptidase
MAGMLPEDVYGLAGVADPRLSPDGATIAYVVWGAGRRGNAYRSAIYLVELDGSAPPRKLTAGEREDAAPRWSPDGRLLAFLQAELLGEGHPAQRGEPPRPHSPFRARLQAELLGEGHPAQRGEPPRPHSPFRARLQAELLGEGHPVREWSHLGQTPNRNDP